MPLNSRIMPRNRTDAKTSQRQQDVNPPRDEGAERYAVGAILFGAHHEEMVPDLLFHPGRRALLLAAEVLRSEGGDSWPLQMTSHPRDELSAALARATRVMQAVLQSGQWESPEEIEWEMRQCIDACNGNIHELTYRVGLLKQAYRRRLAIAVGNSLVSAALDPGSDCGAVLCGVDAEELRTGRQFSSSAQMVTLADVHSTAIRWLWPKRIARGKLSIIAGQPGLGKSLITIDMAARVSRGATFPDRESGPIASDVIFMSAEDDPSDTIRPRLDAAGADVHRVHMLESKAFIDKESGQRRQKSVSLADLPVLEDALSQFPDCRLLIIDPITAYLEGIDSHRNSDVRGLLAPLSSLAHKHDVAIVAVTHLSKCGDGGRSALERVSGSLAFAAAARSVWAVGPDRDHPSRRIVACAKNNLGPDSSGLAYTITPTPDGVPVLTWEADPVETSADELLTPVDRDHESSGSALQEAKEWLIAELSDGPVMASELRKRANRDGQSWHGAVRRAKTVLGIKPRKQGMDGWVWELPEGAQCSEDTPQDPE